MKLFSLLPKRLVHFACNSPCPNGLSSAGIPLLSFAIEGERRAV